jgi:NAD-dependent deacetylase
LEKKEIDMSRSLTENIKELSDMLKAASKITVFTGAGISTESGIPDFRGPNGIWKSMTPIDFSDFVASEEVRRESWRRKFSADAMMSNAEPNTGHLGVLALDQLGKLKAVITQNVDGLHQKSGITAEKVIELHGNANYATCLDCHKHFELSALEKIFRQEETVPYCDLCGGIIKTATISFGQSMPSGPMDLSQQAVMDCDLLLAMGSSLTVYPAASFPRIAKKNGAQLIIINNEATDLDPVCDLVLHEPIGVTLTSALGL